MPTTSDFSQDELGEYTVTIGNIILSNTSPKADQFFTIFVENMIVQVVKENEMIDLNALLLMSCFKNNEHLVMSLLKLGATMEAQSLTLSTPIMYITQHGNLPMLKFFVDSGANVFAQNEKGHNAFAYAKAGSEVHNYLSFVMAEKKKTQEMVMQENQRLKEQLALLQAHAGQINPQEYMALKTQLLALQQQLAYDDDIDSRRKVRKNVEAVEMEG